MTRAQQTEAERECVSEMVRMLSLDLQDEPVSQEPPKPDFLLVPFDGRRVGLEVTDVRDTDRAASWNDLTRFQGSLEKRLAREGIRVAVDGYVYIENASCLRSRQASAAVIETIVGLAREWATSGRQPSKSALLRLGLDFIRYVQFRDAATPGALFATSAMPLSSDVVQGAIDRKARKLLSYRDMDASEYWLLLVGGAAISGYVPAEDVRRGRYASPFARTIYLDRSEPACFDLSTVKDDLVLESDGTDA